MDWDNCKVVIVEGIGKNQSIGMALKAFNGENSNTYMVHGVRQINSKKKLAALLEAGAQDLRA